MLTQILIIEYLEQNKNKNRINEFHNRFWICKIGL